MNEHEDDLVKRKVNYKTWSKILKTVLLHKKNFILLLVSVVLLACLDVIFPLLNGYAIDVFFENKNFESENTFIIWYVLVSISYFFAVGGFLYFAGNIEAYTSYDLRKQAYENIQRLSFSYFDKTPQGWLMARMTSDSRKLSSILSWGLVDLLWGLFTMVGILIVLFVLEWRLAIIVLILLPILICVSFFIRKKILQAYRNSRKMNSKITASYNEAFMGIKTTKTLVIEDKNQMEFNDKVYKLRKSSLRAILFSSMFGPAVFLIGYIAVTMTIYDGSEMFLNGLLTLGTLYMFIDYTIKFFDPITNLAVVLSDFQNAQASAERIISLIEEKQEIVDREDVLEKYGTIFEPKKENWEKLEGTIDFVNVSFRYVLNEDVLTNFNLHIGASQTVALVGHTGSGKSTIVNLICRFYEPTSGKILIDGKDYKERSIGWLHSNLGYVLQEPQLFTGTVFDNIRYGKLDATLDEVIEAAKIANAHSFIMKMDQGYYSTVGEGGSRLSLGEKQLISFARAIVSNPRILVLDEATSSVDTETEALIQNAVEKILNGRTSIVVAHRLSTIVNSDLILVLKDGEVIESGTHLELLANKGYYYKLYKTQFINERMEEENII